jgi:hypothetical protein
LRIDRRFARYPGLDASVHLWCSMSAAAIMRKPTVALADYLEVERRRGACESFFAQNCCRIGLHRASRGDITRKKAHRYQDADYEDQSGRVERLNLEK